MESRLEMTKKILEYIDHQYTFTFALEDPFLFFFLYISFFFLFNSTISDKYIFIIKISK